MWKIPESPQSAYQTNRLASALSCNCHHGVQPGASQTTQKTVCKVAKWYSSQNYTQIVPDNICLINRRDLSSCLYFGDKS